MISVTVAAHGGRKRCVGAHLRAYGSGRLSICDLDRETPNIKQKHMNGLFLHMLSKLLEAIAVALRFCFSFLSPSATRPHIVYVKTAVQPKTTVITQSKNKHFSEQILKRIFSHLDGRSVISCEMVCKRWRRVIGKNSDFLPKLKLDQLRILFDEGEVILYPSDEKKTPTRHAMPSLQILSLRLRHLHVESLLVRGMIPIEAVPVLRALCSFSLYPKQIYFIWSKFSPDSISLLQELLTRNKRSLVDFGLEDCSPTNLLTDDLIADVAQNLSSLRVWNDGRGGLHGITDKTIHLMTDAIISGHLIETLDLSSCVLSHEAISMLILAWAERPQTDFSVSILHSYTFRKEILSSVLASHGIYLREGCLRKDKHCLTVFC